MISLDGQRRCARMSFPSVALHEAGRLTPRRFAKTVSNLCARVPGAQSNEITVTGRAACESFRAGEKLLANRELTAES